MYLHMVGILQTTPPKNFEERNWKRETEVTKKSFFKNILTYVSFSEIFTKLKKYGSSV